MPLASRARERRRHDDAGRLQPLRLEGRAPWGARGLGIRASRGGPRGAARDGRSPPRPYGCRVDVPALRARASGTLLDRHPAHRSRGVAPLPVGRLECSSRCCTSASSGSPRRASSVSAASAKQRSSSTLSAKDWRRGAARHAAQTDPGAVLARCLRRADRRVRRAGSAAPAPHGCPRARVVLDEVTKAFACLRRQQQPGRNGAQSGAARGGVQCEPAGLRDGSAAT